MCAHPYVEGIYSNNQITFNAAAFGLVEEQEDSEEEKHPMCVSLPFLRVSMGVTFATLWAKVGLKVERVFVLGRKPKVVSKH